jgi:hypothetical protein
MREKRAPSYVPVAVTDNGPGKATACLRALYAMARAKQDATEASR